MWQHAATPLHVHTPFKLKWSKLWHPVELKWQSSRHLSESHCLLHCVNITRGSKENNISFQDVRFHTIFNTPPFQRTNNNLYKTLWYGFRPQANKADRPAGSEHVNVWHQLQSQERKPTGIATLNRTFSEIPPTCKAVGKARNDV